MSQSGNNNTPQLIQADNNGPRRRCFVGQTRLSCANQAQLASVTQKNLA